MVLAWMAYSVLFGTLVCAGALAAERVAATWSRAQRFIWAGALVTAVAVPPIFATRPRISASAAAFETVGTATVSDGQFTLALGSPRAPTRQPMSMSARVSRIVAGSDNFVLGAWAFGSLAGLALIARATIGLRRRRSRWQRVEIDGVSV